MSNAVPHGWSVQPLGKLADVRSSNVDKKSDASELPVRLCNYTDVYYRNRITSDIDFMHATAKQGEIDRFALQKGDVIITKDSETPDDIAVPALVSESLPSVICGYHLTLLRPEPDRSNGEFLAHLFQLQSVQHYFYLLANGTTRFGLTAEAINTAPLITPPLPEQQKIATILSSVDDVIEKTHAQIDKLKDLKTGMMQELLTKGIGHTEFKDSPVGRIPSEWEVLPLESIVENIVDCEHKTAPYVENSEFLVVRTSNVRDGEIVYEDMRFTTGEAFSEWTKRAVPADGDVLFTREAPAGESCMVPAGLKICMGQRMVLLRPKVNKVYPDYFSLYLTSEAAKLAIYELSIGTTVTRINIEDIKRIPCVVPSVKEQREIHLKVSSIQSVISQKELLLSSIESTKKALMQDLLTGKVRVKLNESTATENA